MIEHNEAYYTGLMQKASQKIAALQEEIAQFRSGRREPIAIIGHACRFPGANNSDEFWELLSKGKDAVCEVPPERWDNTEYYDPEPDAPGKIYTRFGGFIQKVDQFDPHFFNISPREALSIDPQQRLLLEVSWEALENAALPPLQLPRQTGIFVGISDRDYFHLLLQQGEHKIDGYLSAGNDSSMASGRLAYFFGVEGPVLSLDTACSSSLASVHLAVHSLRRKECDLALAGGVNLILSPTVSIGTSKAHMLAADGHCKTFDAKADGYVRGEGCGMAVLKRLSDAQKDGNRIIAVIRGSALNHDGRTSGLTVPSGPSQQAVIRQALQDAGIKPEEVAYVEAHGTGTSLGDPIEVGALGHVFNNRTQALLIGSVKTNIGHLESAAGIAGLMKTVLALSHSSIPPSLNLTQSNPLIAWDRLPIEVVRANMPWPEGKPIAGVSSFSFSGTNCHIVLEAYQQPSAELGKESATPHLFTLSAKTPAALAEMARQYATYLDRKTAGPLRDICFTLNTGRQAFKSRLAVVADSKPALREKLSNWLNAPHAAPPKISGETAFLFTGQGSQHVGMGKQLYATSSLFRRVLNQCDEILATLLDRPLLSLLFEDHDAAINLTLYTQPVLFSFEYALCRLWQSWGIKPDYVMGHSVGEYVAACVAGVFSLEDALKLVAARGRLIQSCEPGDMVAIRLDESGTQPLLADCREDVGIAALNGPRNTVISGKKAAIQHIVANLEKKGINHTALNVSHAFHSPLVDGILAEFSRIAQQIAYHSPTIPMVSNITGRQVSDEATRADYWVKHIRASVRFEDGIHHLYQQGCRRFIEMGPMPTLTSMGKQCVMDEDNMLWLASLRKNRPDWEELLDSLGQCFVSGKQIDWDSLWRDLGATGCKLELPTYPFQRERHWVDLPKTPRLSRLSPLLDKKVYLPRGRQTLFETEFSPENLPFLADHRVFGNVVSPAACHLCLLLDALGHLHGAPSRQLLDVVFPEPLVITENPPVTVQALIGEKAWELISFNADNSAHIHATGELGNQPASVNEKIDLVALQQQCHQTVDIERIYSASPDISFGPSFRWLSQVSTDQQDTVLAKLQCPETLSLHGYRLHPGLLDACLQITVALPPETGESGAHLPFALESLSLQEPVAGAAWFCLAKRNDQGKWNIRLIGENGQCLMSLQGFETREAKNTQARQVWRDWLYQISWRSKPQSALIADCFAPFRQLENQLKSGLPQHLAESNIDLEQHARHERQLERLSLTFIIDALSKLGFQWHPGTCWQTAQLVRQLKIAHPHFKLFKHLLMVLAEAGYLQHSPPDNWRVVRVPDSPSTPSTPLPDEAAFKLLQRCGTRLAEVLNGTQNPLDLLFPDGDYSLVNQLYSNLPSLELMNGLVHRFVRQLLKSLPDGRIINILEIGAGTAGTTISILPVLSAHNTQYTFTDIGQGFLNLARERFADLPFIQYRRLDIEQAPALQGFEPHHYDLVIAANVVHATRNLSHVAQHIQQLLKPQGVLLLLEDTSPKAWVDLTFGLTDGWWRFEDHDTRTDYPLLNPQQWQAFLVRAGFQSAFALTYPDLGEAVIAAQSPAKASEAKTLPWLIIGQGGDGQILSDALDDFGHPTVIASPNLHSTEYTDLFSNLPDLAGVVHMVSLSVAEPSSAQELEAAAHTVCGSALYLTQALLSRYASPPPLYLVTASAQVVRPEDKAENYVQGSLWGLGRTIALEHPELGAVLVDLERGMTATETANALMTELFKSPNKEPTDNQVAWRSNQRYVARLTRHAQTTTSPPTEAEPSYHLELSEPGSIDNLRQAATTRRNPQPGEVEIKVQASSLNFRDLLKTLDLYPDRQEPMGDECSGEVVAVGAGVTGFALGDAVIVCAAGCFTQYLTVDAKDVFLKPANLSHEEAAGLPGVFMTADYALNHLARIKAGDRILIHAAAGGVGMAAVQIARIAGAELFCTASPSKWEALKKLGMEHIYHSRTLDFSKQILADTQGRGVDVVLNSLTGRDFINNSVAVLRPQGCFIEMAKRDIWSREQMLSTRSDVQYHIVDMAQQPPDRLRSLLCKLLPQFADGKLQALPHTDFPIHRASEAFRHMQQAKHVGKIVITQNQARTASIQANASYLISGGLGGLGLLTAQWLAEQGAKHLILVGRSQPKPEAQTVLQQLTAMGVAVKTVQADIAIAEQAAQAIAAVDARYPLKGIIHAAGVLDDGALLNMDWQRFKTVFAPKMFGAWNLHHLTKACHLDFFVMYSSVTGVFGTRGQSSHAAANTFLDALASHRYQTHKNGLSIAWGAWSDIGSAAAMANDSRQFTSQGFGAIAPAQGEQTLDYLFTQPVPSLVVSPIDWTQFNQAFGTDSGFHADLHTETPSQDTASVKTPQTTALSPRQQLEVLPEGERNALLMQQLRTTTAQVLGLPSSSQVDPEDKLMEAGLDSLMAIELRNRLNKLLELKLPATLVFDYPTLALMHRHLLAKLCPEPTSAMDEIVPEPKAAAADGLDALNQDELAALLMQELEQEN
jgi:acyl transferase domain-containing protein/SAM-dependent methyltransferase/aryl carrier-like protein